MSSLRNAVKRITHKERSQLSSRHGFLEKHKDYIQRSQDYRNKQSYLKSLKRKASSRNPDEYYFKMSGTKQSEADGKCIVSKDLEKTSNKQLAKNERVVKKVTIDKSRRGNALYHRSIQNSRTNSLRSSLHLDNLSTTTKKKRKKENTENKNESDELTHQDPFLDSPIFIQNKTKSRVAISKVQQSRMKAYRTLERFSRREDKIELENGKHQTKDNKRSRNVKVRMK
jgi:U3 small nucleolar RNA-associated protein 11